MALCVPGYGLCECAAVCFAGDGYSNLPDPSFMLRSGDVCRVALLIGKTYTVTSDQPLCVVDQSDCDIEIEGDGTAVIFEEAYTNGPGEVVARRSTNATLTCVAHGGERGGVAEFTLQDASRLNVVSGRPLPVTQFVPPGQMLEFRVVYEGVEPSAGEEDIVAKAKFTERETGTVLPIDKAYLTSIKLSLEAVYEAPENPNPSRHVYGVGEKVRFQSFPVLSNVRYDVRKYDVGDMRTIHDKFLGFLHGDVVNAMSPRIYVCPAVGVSPQIEVSYGNVKYKPMLQIVEPQYVVTTVAYGMGSYHIGEVGMGLLVTTNCIGPMTVSFQGVRFFEVPCTNAIPPIGYFATENYTGDLTHIPPNAGPLHTIGTNNYWMCDEAGIVGAYNNWSAGTLIWKIPIGWRRMRYEDDSDFCAYEADYYYHGDRSSRPLLLGGSDEAYVQIFTIESNGRSSVQKFGYCLSRSRWNTKGTVMQLDNE